jgi:hypothetical protein
MLGPVVIASKPNAGSCKLHVNIPDGAPLMRQDFQLEAGEEGSNKSGTVPALACGDGQARKLQDKERNILSVQYLLHVTGCCV